MRSESQNPRRDIEKRLLRGLTLPRDEVRSRLAMAADAAYWKALFPSFTIGDDAAPPEVPALDEAKLSKLKTSLDAYGYFASEGALVNAITKPMLDCVEAVRSAGWPPVFAYVYDELWTIWHTAPIVQLVTAGLGSGYRWIPHGWCHYVNPVRGASGWPPHVDGNLSNRMSIWIPLTDATLDNGCIYVVPGDFNTSGIGERRKLGAASNLQMRELLQRGRALPARAGALLGWHFRILHWGSTCHLAGDPRVSLVMEFIGAGESAMASEMPLYDPREPLPPLPHRLRAIGRAIMQYKRFELRMRRYVDLARELIAHETVSRG